MRVFFAISTLPFKLRHIFVVRSEPNRAAIAPPSRRRRAATAATPLVPCRFAVLGESLLGANGVYTANYNLKCVFFSLPVNYDSNASRTLQVCGPGRIPVRGQLRL